MGWNVSMILIQNPNMFNDEQLLLASLGLDNYKYAGETVLDECMSPEDDSISIGYYNNCIIICDGFKIIDSFINDVITYRERNIIKLFPNSEVLSVACLSATNLHAYSLIDKGLKIRVKSMDADHGKVLDAGERIKEEISIYESGHLIENKNIWKSDSLPDALFSEDQMMEEFTFGLAKRLLGVRIDTDEGDNLLFEIPFKKHIKQALDKERPVASMSGVWIGSFEYGPLYGVELYGQSVTFRLSLEENGDGEFKGTCNDLVGIGSNKQTADISGFLDGDFISFTKEYPTINTFDENGNMTEDSTHILSSLLTYKGTYNQTIGFFTGEWEICSVFKNDIGSTFEEIVYGTWEMKKER